MASESTNHDQEHKKLGECESVDGNSTHHVPPPRSRDNPAGYRPSYPSSTRYPPPPPPGPYPGCPPPSCYPNAQAQAPAPEAAASGAYYNAKVVHDQKQDRHQRSLGCLQCFVTTIKFVMLFGITSSIIGLGALSPQLPVFHVDNFSVSNFNATLPTFTANWEAVLTVHNPNTNLKIEFGQLHNYVIYGEDYDLASSIAHPFSLGTNKSNVVHAKLSANNKDNLVENSVVKKLAKERRSNGTVSFNFKMEFSTTFVSDVWWKTHSSMEVLCEDIPVTFLGASGFGSSNIAVNGNQDCLTFTNE